MPRGRLPPARLYGWLLAATLASGCYFAPLHLDPGEAARVDLKLRPGASQLIQLDAVGLSESGAEVTITVDDLRLPPIYFGLFDRAASAAARSPSGAKSPSVFSSASASERHRVSRGQLWSSFWPVAPDAQVKVSNYGPSPITLTRLWAEAGDRERLLRHAEKFSPFPPIGRVDLQEALEKSRVEGIEDARALNDLPSLRAWAVERRRRAAFERIEGLPLAMRLGDRLLGDVQVRACILDSRAAVIGLSRPDPSSWGSLGSGWMPPRDDARWTPLPTGDRPLPKSFRVQGQLHGLALFLAASAEPASASGARSVGAVAAAKLFRLDTPAPVAAVEWQGLEPEGRWVEIAFEGGPLAAGDYVLELRALRGAPAWLGWNRVPERIAGSDLTTVVETLLVRQSPPEVRYDQPIPVRLRVVGRADPIERLKGAEATPKSEPARYEDYEMVFEAQLLPGDTEILFLNDYRP